MKQQLVEHLETEHAAHFRPMPDGSPAIVMRDWLEQFHQRRHEYEEVPDDHTADGHHRQGVRA